MILKVLAVLGLVSLGNSENILYLIGIPSPSLLIWNLEIINRLASHGHNITVMSADSDANPPANVTYLRLDQLYSDLREEFRKSIFNYSANIGSFKQPISYHNACFEMCKITVETDPYKALLRYPSDFRFDLLIYDFTCGPCLLPFLHRFNYPPLVAVTSFNQPSFTTSVSGSHQYYSYVPHNSVTYQGDMSLLQRAHNLLVYVVENLHWQNIFLPKLHELGVAKISADLPPMSDLEKRTSIVLVNTNPSIDFPEPLPNNVIAVGGLHIKEPQKLPEELESFINTSKKGAVLFSLGTNCRSDLMDQSKQKLIIEAFRQLPNYHFLWKFESDAPLKLPKNVMIRKWLPQSDILAHPKIKAFFTHSGLLSIQEAIWRGVPVVGMPLIYDQHRNILKSIQSGFGESVDFQTMTTVEIKDKLLKVLEDPKYAANVKKISARYRDQMEKPLDRAVWWIEWALRNPDSSSMKSPLSRLGHIRGNAFDLVAALVVALILVAIIFWKVLACITRWICGTDATKRTNGKRHAKRE